MTAAQELIRAVTDSDLVGVQEALGAGAPPDTTTEDFAKLPVLSIAAQQGDREVVEALLKAGATPDIAGGYEWTPLRAAARFGRASVVRLLLAAGVDPNPSYSRGAILMDAVAATRHWPTPEALETVQLLLDAGATGRPEDDPPIVLAAASESPPAVVRLFLERGADPNATRSDGAPAIVVAAMRRDASLVGELLAAGADVDAVDANGRTALMHAVERGADGIVASLLCAGADKSRKSGDGSTAHTLARAWGRQYVRFMMGEQSVGREVIDAPRTVVYPRARVVQLLGDRRCLEQLGALVEHALNDLGDDEFETLVGTPAGEARRVRDHLRTAQQDHPQSRSLKYVDITQEEQAIIRGALLNLAYGPPMDMPPGMTRVQIADIFEDFDEFYR